MPNSKGWVKLNRSIMNWEHWDDPLTLKLFLWLVMNANTTDGEFMGKKIHRGSLATSYSRIASAIGTTEDKVRTRLNTLISTGEITKCSTPKFSVITVKNYNLYQSKSHSKSHKNSHDNSQQSKNIYEEGGERKNAPTDRRYECV